MKHPVTPDGRYFVVKGRLWRCTDPALGPEKRGGLVRQLMVGWSAKKNAVRLQDADGRKAAMRSIEEAKVALGERGPVWWADGAPDYNRHMARTTPYAAWFAALPDGDSSSK